MELTAGRRPTGWSLVSIGLATLVAGPLLVLPLAFVRDGGMDSIARTLLPEALRTSLLLGLGVGVGTLVVGGGLACLVSFWDFPGRRILDWALVLPLAVPGYVLVFVVLGQYGQATPLQSNLFGDGLRIDGIRSPLGAVVILTAVLYPYVYILGRSAFLGQSRRDLEAARSLGLGHAAAVRRVAVPLARPALAGGVALAVMETLADFGAVDLLGVQALTSAIFRTWNGVFDQDAALQLATVLVGVSLTLVTIERLLRGRARYVQALGAGDAVEPKPLRGLPAVVATIVPTALLAFVFVIPVVQLGAWSVETIVEGDLADDLAGAARTTLLLGGLSALVAAITATVVVYGQRTQPSPIGRGAARLATVGYAVPGTVVAVAVYAPLVWLDRRLIDWFGVSELLFTGTVVGLTIAYLVRFHALAYFAVESRMSRVSPTLDDAARALGADRARVLADVHVPLLRPGIVTAALLVLVEVMKELPATALLRPLGGDTLAVTVWETTKDSRFDAAALPALLIVGVGLIPVIMLVRLLRTDGWTAAADRV